MVDIGLNIETEPTPLPGSSRCVRYNTQTPLQEALVTSSRATSSRSLLRVTPHYAPRPMVEPSPALKSLLVGAQLSHYNYLVGSAKTPTKQDYFHEKTLIYNFTPSFRASHFAHSKYELPRRSEKLPIMALPDTPPARKISSSHFHSRVLSIHKQLPKSKPVTEEQSRPLTSTGSKKNLRFSTYTKASLPRPRPILCVQDGQNLSKQQIRTHMIDFLDYIQKYIGFISNPDPQPELREAISLRNQGLMDLIETVSQVLKPSKPFTTVFTVDGEKVEDLALLPSTCRVLLFSSTGKFKGVEDA